MNPQKLVELTKFQDSVNEVMPESLTIEELLQERERALLLQEQIVAAVSVYTDEIKNRLEEEHLTGKVVGNTLISRITRTNFDVDLEKARELGAITIKEVVSVEILKQMVKLGANIPTKTIEYLTIKEVENGTEN